ncbi:hypothetical protein OSTOST_18220, partial [Ostertagia ostertagi]
MRNLRKAVSVLVEPAFPSTNFPVSSKKTTVLLLGWAAARDEHLSKYSEIYERRRYSRDVSGVVGDLRTVLERPDTRLALHLFSMNAVYTQFVRSQMGMSLSNFTPYHFVRDHPSIPKNLLFVYSDRDTICPP